VLFGSFIEIQVTACTSQGNATQQNDGTQANAVDSAKADTPKASPPPDGKTPPKSPHQVRLASAETADLVSVSFLNTETGAVWSAEGIGYRTVDGGLTWRKTDDLKVGAIRRVRETEARRWAVTANGALYSWTRVRLGWSPGGSTTRALDLAVVNGAPLILDRSSQVRSPERLWLASDTLDLIAVAAREASSGTHLGLGQPFACRLRADSGPAAGRGFGSRG
jgi:hypothetical protein